MGFKNIIFDIDGTLLDSYHVYMQSTKKAIKEVLNYDITQKEEDDFFHFTNNQMFEALGIANEEEKKLKINKLTDKYIHSTKVSLFDGVDKLLEYLKSNNYFLAINTSRTSKEIMEQQCLIDIIKYFDFIVTSDKVKKPKPNKESTLLIINSNNLDVNETIMIGDSVNDSLTSYNAGISFGIAAWGARDKSVACNLFLENIDDIYKILKKND